MLFFFLFIFILHAAHKGQIDTVFVRKFMKLSIDWRIVPTKRIIVLYFA